LEKINLTQRHCGIYANCVFEEEIKSRQIPYRFLYILLIRQSKIAILSPTDKAAFTETNCNQFICKEAPTERIKDMTIALILSGGTGTRLGSELPKQYIEVGGRPIISYSIDRLFSHDRIDAIQIVADPIWQEQIKVWLTADGFDRKFRGFSSPGGNRQLSILHGLEDIREYASEDDYVFIHDAARPLLSGQQITDCMTGAEGHDGVLPVLPMKDTVYSSTDGKRITSLLERNEIYAGQAPELFRLGVYYEANCRLLPDLIWKINGSTEPAIMAGMDIVMIPGDEGNFKITTKEDLERFRKIVEEP
jgi:2-C-methyl-D-erythritol 4-phosphate cytidylyltransferase